MPRGPAPRSRAKAGPMCSSTAPSAQMRSEDSRHRGPATAGPEGSRHAAPGPGESFVCSHALARRLMQAPGRGCAARRWAPCLHADPDESALTLEHPVGNGRPCTYIHCTDPVYAPLASSREWVRRQHGWAWQEIATAHDAMVTAPAELVRVLVDIGAA